MTTTRGIALLAVSVASVLAIEGCGGGGGDGDGGSDQPSGPRCGDGAAEGNEECDGVDLRGDTCASLHPSTPIGTLRCTACAIDDALCRVSSPGDDDGDGVVNDEDDDPGNFRICRDADGDGCDDCSVTGTATPANDGYDETDDGQCEIPLDYDCMNGANAGSDPSREKACIVFSLMNADRALFPQESGNAPPLVWNEAIWQVAIAHSIDMCDRGFFDHDNPDGDSPSDRAMAAGLGFAVAENLAANVDPSATERAWMFEPTCQGHRLNILSPRSTEVGIGYHECDHPNSYYTNGYEYGRNDHVTADYRTSNVSTPAYCSNAATSCEIPPNPPSAAVCPASIASNPNFEFCGPSSSEAVMGWGCPND